MYPLHTPGYVYCIPVAFTSDIVIDLLMNVEVSNSQ